MCWQCLDGKKDTVIIIEELARVTDAGKASEDFGRLISEGRKYGAIIIATTQRSQEIDKTIFGQVNAKFIGGHEVRDAEYLDKACNVPAGEIVALTQGEFIRKEAGNLHINLGKSLPTTGRKPATTPRKPKSAPDPKKTKKSLTTT